MACTNEPRDSTGDRRGARGFTLIELLVVIGIITMLVAALSPAILDALTQGDEAQTKARQQGLVTMIKGFELDKGFYPPADFTVLDEQIEGLKIKRDAINSGIESLVIYLCWEDRGGARLDEHEDWLGNTDGDSNDVAIPLLARKAKVEVVDAWGMPFAYFDSKFGGYEGAQTIRTAGSEGFPGEDIEAKPHKNPRNGMPLGPRTFQLISAGADGQFNTEDDIVYPNPPRD